MLLKKVDVNTLEFDDGVFKSETILECEGYVFLEVGNGLNENYVKAALIDGVIVLIEDSVAKKAYLIDQAYQQLQADVYAQMALVFGTNKSDSAAASERTWEKMLAKPSLYVGSLFANEAAVLAEASEKVPQCEAYSVYRLERIAQFRLARAAIIAAK
jgi:hypothetical protein